MKYPDDFINKIIQGDCLEVMKQMPDKSVDLVVTSPPYNKQAVGGKLVKKVKYNENKDTMPEKEYQEWQIKVLNECWRVGNVMFYNHKIRYQNGKAIHPMEWILKTKWKLHQEIIWNRKITGNIRGWRCWNIDERIYWLVKEKPKEISQELAQLTSIWDIRPETKIEHPAPFPIKIAERCIMLGSKKNDTILDPFAGSGTTGVACMNLKRNYILIEKEEKYCEIARNRIARIPPSFGV